MTKLTRSLQRSLFDVRPFLAAFIAYGLAIAIIIVLYYVISLSIEISLYDIGVRDELDWIDAVVVVSLVVLFHPVRHFFSRFASAIFFEVVYDSDVFYTKLSHAISGTNDLREVALRAASIIAQTLKAADVSFVLYTGKDRSEQIGVGRFGKISYKDVLWLSEHLGRQYDEPRVLRLLDHTTPLRRMMVSHRVAVIVPLVKQGVTMGYLFLGEHKRSSYSARDVQVLRSVADEIVIAVQNALSVEQIKELNGHLEQRVDAATKELRANNAQLQKLDEAKDEFISMASHQLRTPLTSIKGYLSMLIDGDVGKVSNEQKHMLNEAFVSSERMVRLIGDFLNVSRLQTGKFVIEKHPVDLSLLVRRELDGLAPTAAARGMKFSYTAPKNIPSLDLDESKIQQVVMNFADNAIYYSKEKATIKVSLKKVAGGVEFTVKDNGIGVPQVEQAQLFNKFFRATNARRARPDGTGVGLFLAQKVVDEHGGTIIFASTEGKGSTFGFRLPV